MKIVPAAALHLAVGTAINAGCRLTKVTSGILFGEKKDQETGNGRGDPWPPGFAICNLQFTMSNPIGGIAQLVERQLCKLEVRGSNPLASKA